MQRENFLIIGFTGSIGSGCTTLAKSLEKYSPKIFLQETKEYSTVISDLKKINIDLISKKTINSDEIFSLQKQYKSLLEKRIYIQKLMDIDKLKFKYISLSDIIILNILLEKEIKFLNDFHKDIKEKILLIKHNYKNVIDNYNAFIKSPDDDYKNIKLIRKADFDELFLKIEEIKKEIKEIEFKNLSVGNKSLLQELGNKIRNFGKPFEDTKEETSGSFTKNYAKLAEDANKLIKFYGHHQEYKYNYFVIDSFKNPTEVNFFRKRYSAFYLVSIFASETTRKNRVKKHFNIKKINLNQDSKLKEFNRVFEIFDDRDEGKEFSNERLYAQNVSKCSYLSDISINNEIDSKNYGKELYRKFLKYMALILFPGCLQPTKEETLMNLAYSLSLRSSCISRQVGAVITDKNGYILGLGWNDVAESEIGCGLRFESDFINDKDNFFNLNIFKDFLSNDDFSIKIKPTSNKKITDRYFCFKDIYSKKHIKQEIIKKIPFQNFKEEIKIEIKDITEENIQKIYTKFIEYINSKLKIKRLEYCRALHAEENAILQVAARGGVGIEGGTIFTTTFPCELCAKKIYQTGIRKIYYTEYYPDSISENVFLKDGMRTIEIKQFEGVKSYSYFKLYKSDYDKKDEQEMIF